jgi:hypothetical protein
VQKTGRVPPTAGPPSSRPSNEPDEGGRIFTAHVRRLAQPDRGGPGAPGNRGEDDRRAFDELWGALRTALRSELRKRGLWEGPPAYLGIVGRESWEEPGGRAGWGTGDALDELLADCYTYIFLDRLRSLRAQLEFKDNVDGLVFLNIRHFLHERQREHDPLGFRVFEVLRGALQAAVEAGELHLLAGDPRVRNDTRLGFAPETAQVESAGSGGTHAAGRLREIAARWSCNLLPELVTARGKDEARVTGRLRALLPELRAEGIAAFSFKELVDPLKAEVREQWAALLAVDDPGAPEAPAPSRPDLLAEGREGFRKLVACVQAALDRLEAAETTRAYLATLWQYLRIWASYPEPVAGPEPNPASGPTSPTEPVPDLLPGVVSAAGNIGAIGDIGAIGAIGDEGDELPSQRRLAEHLRIPRERLPGLFGTLKRILARCQAAAGWKTAVTDRDESTTHSARGGAA